MSNNNGKAITAAMKKWLLLALVLGLGVGLWQSGLLSLDGAKQLQQWAAQSPMVAVSVFFAVYVVVTALSLPGAALLTLVAGALFGFWWGLLLVSFASSLGATGAFLVSRTLLRDWVQSKFQRQLRTINAGVEREGAFYLFSLRLIPYIPFFVINLVFGLTTMRPLTFYVVSQVGMLLGTAVYVNAGAQLGDIDSLQVSSVLSPELMIAFCLLAAFPWLAKALMGRIQQWRLYRQYFKDRPKPKRFDYNVVVIGAGSAGLVSAYIAAAVKAKVALIEKSAMGGDCLNTGCVPSKTLIKSAAAKHAVDSAADYGIEVDRSRVDFSAVMARIRHVISRIEPHDSIARYEKLGVDCIQGEAEVLSPYEVQVNGRIITARRLIIATGARPAIPNINGIDECLQKHQALTSDTIWRLEALPSRLLVLGGGPIGCELAQAFQRLGSKVTLVCNSQQLLPREDVDVAQLLHDTLVQEGVSCVYNTEVSQVRPNGDEVEVTLSSDSLNQNWLTFDKILLATGRAANTRGYGFDRLQLATTERGTLAVDEQLRTRFPSVFACGDVVGPYQFTHMASHQAWYATVNALFGGWKSFKVDYRIVPWAIFTAPEIARVGINEREAKEKNLDYEVTTYGLDDLDRAIADGSDYGMVKVLTETGKDKILGATIVGERASDMLGEFITAMKHNKGLNSVLGTIHIYPTLLEANKFNAGAWKRAHAPEKLLRWVERYQRWLRS